MTDSIPKKPLKKGSLVFVDRENYIKSIEALASDDDLPNYCLLYTSPSPRD